MLRGFVVLALPLLAASGRAQGMRYLGPHPLDLEGNWHVVEGIHEHGVLPVGLEPFAEAGGVQIFLGDPVAYGYVQPVFGYVGGHPLPSPVLGYCGIAGAHRHPFVPEGSYQRDGEGNHVYRGAFRGGRRIVVPRRTTPPRPVVVGTPTIPFPTPYGYLPGFGYGYGPWAPSVPGGPVPPRPPPMHTPPEAPAVTPRAVPVLPAAPDPRIHRTVVPSAGGGTR